jgi:hypothetical protein
LNPANWWVFDLDMLTYTTPEDRDIEREFVVVQARFCRVLALDRKDLRDGIADGLTCRLRAASGTDRDWAEDSRQRAV